MYNNPILELQNQRSSGNPVLNPQLIQQFKSISQAVSAAKNPQAMMNQILANNPQMMQAINFIKLMGGDPRTAYYNYAKQVGVDPDIFLNSIKQSLS